MSKLSRDQLLRRAERFAEIAVNEVREAERSGDNPEHRAELVQNAAGKAWAAARMAASAATERATGSRPRGTEKLLDAVYELAKERRDFAEIDGLLQSAHSELHLGCSEAGECSARTPGRVHAIKDRLVPLAKRVAR